VIEPFSFERAEIDSAPTFTRQRKNTRMAGDHTGSPLQINGQKKQTNKADKTKRSSNAFCFFVGFADTTIPAFCIIHSALFLLFL
jgi:hypothetical protein